jgi:hypothetical protein
MKNLKEDRPDEKAGVFRALEVFENFAENASERVIPALIKLDILSWLVNRICVKEDKFDHLRLCVKINHLAKGFVSRAYHAWFVPL